MKNWNVCVMACLALFGFAATSDARPGATCAKACQRFSSCKLLSYNVCMNMCDKQGAENTAALRAENLAQSRMSCSALASQMGSSKWLCTAEGTSAYGYDMDTGVPDERGTHDILMMGTGPTRRAAESKAISECNATMTAQLGLGNSTDELGAGAVVATKCHITQCIAPSSSGRSQRQR
jgi:hypothetical protein